jgi:predicted transcriptional regulator
MNTGERIKEERRRLGLSVGELAGLGWVSKATQLAYENNSLFANTDYLNRFADEGADIVYILIGRRVETWKAD